MVNSFIFLLTINFHAIQVANGALGDHKIKNNYGQMFFKRLMQNSMEDLIKLLGVKFILF